MGDRVGVEEFELLLLSAGFVKRRLSTLRAGLLHWSVFSDLNGTRLKRFVAPLEHLTTLSLVITTGEDEDSDQVATEVEECYWHLLEGGLARFIEGLPNLHCLSVEFDFYDEESFMFGADSGFILGPDGHWPHLRTLHLSCMVLEPEHMMAFFKKHQESLKDLSFTNVSLSGSPHSFLSGMHDILSLQTFQVFGQLWATYDDEIADDEIEELWFLRWPEQKSLVRNAIETFVIDGGEYPLTMDRVNQLEAQDEPDIYQLIREGKYKP
jgi:hypothetical protein